jgi:hypothetical protein
MQHRSGALSQNNGHARLQLPVCPIRLPPIHMPCATMAAGSGQIPAKIDQPASAVADSCQVPNAVTRGHRAQHRGGALWKTGPAGAELVEGMAGRGGACGGHRRPGQSSGDRNRRHAAGAEAGVGTHPAERISQARSGMALSRAEIAMRPVWSVLASGQVDAWNLSERISESPVRVCSDVLCLHTLDGQ